MTDIADRYRRNAEDFTAKVAAVAPSDWANPTPCEGWDARQLVDHVVTTQGMFLGLVGREMGDIPLAADDPLAAWVAATGRIQKDLEDPELAGEEFDGFQGRTTWEAAVDRFLSADLPVHGWDLARATGLDETIDPAEVARLLAEYPAFGDALRGPGVCAAAIESGPGADDQTKLLNFLGRSV